MYFSLTIGAFLVGCQVTTLASASAPIPVWPNKAPGEVAHNEPNKILTNEAKWRQVKRLTNVTRPTLTFYPAAGDVDRPCILVFPGGGYRILAIEHEGSDIAKWANKNNFHAAVLHYRVPDQKDEAFLDAQRAIRLLRHHAEDWHIDPSKIGVLGFSAGGHLAASLSTRPKERTEMPEDHIGLLSARPDFTVLVYPAYLTEKGTLSLKDDIPVSKVTPPAVCIHALDDQIAPQNSIAYALALKNVGVPAGLHVFPKGGHGYGMQSNEPGLAHWPARVLEWLDTMEIVP